MTEEKKYKLVASRASQFLVVAMGDTSYKIISILSDEGDAEKQAKDLAAKDEGSIYAVYEKKGTARIMREVEWRDAA